MTKQHSLVRQILLWLQNRYDPWGRNPRGPASKFHGRVHQTYSEFSETELEGLLSKRAEFDSSQQNRYLFLEPIDKGLGIVPVFAFRYDLRADKTGLWLQLALFIPDGNSLAAIGCRFEPPEGRGTHNYFHAQLFRDFQGGANASLPACPPWLPTTQPAFPLKAHDPVALLICMVISLYGLDRVEDLLQAPFANELKPYMERLCGTAVAQPAAAGTARRRRKGGKG